MLGAIVWVYIISSEDPSFLTKSVFSFLHAYNYLRQNVTKPLSNIVNKKLTPDFFFI